MPLFVEELTKAILESGELEDAGDHYDYAGIARSVTIPATLRDSLTARLDRSPAAKEIAQIGAAIGREFSYELIAAVAPHTKTELDSALNELTDSGLAFRRGTPPEATYSFKHALVQDAAYDSLLKTRRQYLHDKIARVLEEHFPDTKDTEPELLAHHLTAAGKAEAAIGYWQKAAELTSKRMALSEAISHLNHGMEIIGTLPQSPERDGKELNLRIPLGAAWMALKGWTAPEVWTSLHPALALAKYLGRNDALSPILWGLFANVRTQGRIAEALPWIKEMLDAASLTGDPDLLIVAHMAAMAGHFWLGKLIDAREHGEKVLTLYDEKQHGTLVEILNHDPKTFVGAYAAHWTWMLGYPDRAAQICDAKDEHSRQRGHAFDLGFALTTGADLFDYRCEARALRQRAVEAEKLGRENSMPFIWAVLAPIRHGLARIRAGNIAEGLSLLQAGVAAWESSGGKSHNPYLKSAIAEGMALLGDLDGALHLIDEQIAQVERPGWGERVHYAEILRLKGWVLALQGDLEGAEQNYLASLDWARQQKAKSWELRTSTSLARLWQSQSKRKEAYESLAPVYNWFTEGFDTKDLIEAKALLDELAR